jgi:hypothetical protein
MILVSCSSAISSRYVNGVDRSTNNLSASSGLTLTEKASMLAFVFQKLSYPGANPIWTPASTPMPRQGLELTKCRYSGFLACHLFRGVRIHSRAEDDELNDANSLSARRCLRAQTRVERRNLRSGPTWPRNRLNSRRKCGDLRRWHDIRRRHKVSDAVSASMRPERSYLLLRDASRRRLLLRLLSGFCSELSSLRLPSFRAVLWTGTISIL